MSIEEYSEDFLKGPAYALVISISTYEFHPGSGEPQKVFPNLKFADKDAQDFADFLREEDGVIDYNVKLLLNEDAGRKRIISELMDLKRICEETENPLILVYFSGHGSANSDGHYLVPYDGERDDLESTALTNEAFSSYLNKLKTDRLVVFIDACHAGAVEFFKSQSEGKGEPEPQLYDVKQGLGEGDGRYLITSCKSGQSSYEWEERKNGIFTGHLLDLLYCEGGGIGEEYIDVDNLFEALRPRVINTAKKEWKVKQEPSKETKGSRPIVLAIDKKLKGQRILKEAETRHERIAFRDEIHNGMDEDELALKGKVKAYFDKGDIDPGYNDFCNYLEEYFGYWQGGKNVNWVVECVKRLRETHQQIVETRRSSKESPVLASMRARVESSDARGQVETPSTPESIEAVETPKAVDDFKNTAEKIVAGTGASKTIGTPGSQVSSHQSRRKLSQEDQEYILADIKTHRYLGEWKKLSSGLGQPISEKEFDDLVFGIITDETDDETMEEFKKIAARFGERWPAAEEVKTTKASSLMMR